MKFFPLSFYLFLPLKKNKTTHYFVKSNILVPFDIHYSLFDIRYFHSNSKLIRLMLSRQLVYLLASAADVMNKFLMLKRQPGSNPLLLCPLIQKGRYGHII